MAHNVLPMYATLYAGLCAVIPFIIIYLYIWSIINMEYTEKHRQSIYRVIIDVSQELHNTHRDVSTVLYASTPFDNYMKNKEKD